ncbi:MAG: outer membrane protein transport protein [Planctomycetota bacterium]|nr:outer membrane protein transport protein [Planctomycetota bacterium]
MTAGKSIASLAILCLAMVSPALAGGAWVYETGAPEHGTAFAGSAARAGDASTVWFNPAGMTLLDRTQYMVGVIPIFSSNKFSPGSLTSVTGGDGGDAGGFAPGASFYFAHDTTENFKWGLGFGALVGGALDFDDDWVGRYYVTELEMTVLALTPNVAYRFNDHFSIGGGAIIAFGELIQEASVNNFLDSLPDGHLKVEDSDIALGFDFGMMFEVNDRTRFGLMYTSETELDFDDVMETQNVGPALGIILNSQIDMDISIPQAVTLSYHQEVNEDFFIMASAGWQNWEEFGLINITVNNAMGPITTTADINFENTLHGSFGVRYKVGSSSWLSHGVAYDTSPTTVADRNPIFAFDRQVRLTTGYGRTLDSGNSWGVALSYVDLGNNVLDHGDPASLSGRLQGEFGTNEAYFLGFNWNWVR